jgi:hypothetical protein
MCKALFLNYCLLMQIMASYNINQLKKQGRSVVCTYKIILS